MTLVGWALALGLPATLVFYEGVKKRMDATQNPDKGMGILTAIGQIFVGIILPLIMFFVNKGNPAKQWVTDVAREALNFQITMIIAYIAIIVLNIGLAMTQNGVIAMIGGILFFAWFIAWVVFPIIAAVQANGNKVYHYPFAIRLIK